MKTLQAMQAEATVFMGAGQRVQLWTKKDADGSSSLVIWDSVTTKTRVFPNTEINPQKLLYALSVLFIAVSELAAAQGTAQGDQLKVWVDAISGAT